MLIKSVSLADTVKSNAVEYAQASTEVDEMLLQLTPEFPDNFSERMSVHEKLQLIDESVGSDTPSRAGANMLEQIGLLQKRVESATDILQPVAENVRIRYDDDFEAVDDVASVVDVDLELWVKPVTPVDEAPEPDAEPVVSTKDGTNFRLPIDVTAVVEPGGSDVVVSENEEG